MCAPPPPHFSAPSYATGPSCSNSVRSAEKCCQGTKVSWSNTKHVVFSKLLVFISRVLHFVNVSLMSEYPILPNMDSITLHRNLTFVE